MPELSRRQFLTIAGATGLGVGLADCARPPHPTVTTATPGMNMPEVLTTPAQGTPIVPDTDAMHEAGVNDFAKNLKVTSTVIASFG